MSRICTSASTPSFVKPSRKPDLSSPAQIIERVKLSDFEYLASCGSGTFGEVGLFQYIKVDKDGNKKKSKVAIKKVFQNPDYKNREFQIQVRLDHRNIIKILAPNGMYSPCPKNPKGSFLHIVMEYFDKSLYEVIRKSRRDSSYLDAKLIRDYSRQILEGMHYLSKRCIAHRDMKPENILIKYDSIRQPRVAICDFGNAKVLNGTGESISYICTRMYRAPELVYGATIYGPVVDMWSIGCIMIEMCLTTPIFGMTMETVRANNDRPYGKKPDVIDNEDKTVPFELWKDFAMCLGMPTEQDFTEMGAPPGSYEYYMKEASKEPRKNRPFMSGHGVENTLKRIYVDAVLVGKGKRDKKEGTYVGFEELFSDDLIDLLKQILCYSPQRRITVENALKHPYFTSPQPWDVARSG